MPPPDALLPLAPEVPVGDAAYAPELVLRALAPYLSDARRAAIDRVVARRTFSLVPVLEGLVDAGNVNAILRTAEGLGLGAAHLVGLVGEAATIAAHYLDGDEAAGVQARRAAARASSGAHKWLELRAWAQPAAYAAAARAMGYRLVATALTPDAVPIAEVDFSAPTALVVGNERDGVSDALLALADDVVALPLDGFVQSYNVSVAAAVALAHARADRERRTGRHADLSPAERDLLTAHYVARAVPLAEPLLARAAAP